MPDFDFTGLWHTERLRVVEATRNRCLLFDNVKKRYFRIDKAGDGFALNEKANDATEFRFVMRSDTAIRLLGLLDPKFRDFEQPILLPPTPFPEW